MFTLKVFGGAVLLGPDGPLQGRIVQRRQIALLAFLSLQDRPVTRDRLLALLWPEADAERARHSLSDALYVIRRALGEAAVRTTGDDVAIDSSVVQSDVCAFRAALARNDVAAALETFGGPLLDGFHLPDSNAYEEWLATERAALTRSAVAAAEALATDCASRGEMVAAAEAWRRAAALDPHNTRIAIDLARAMAAAGDRAGAIRFIRTHAALLEADYGVAPAPELDALASELTRPARAVPGPAPEAAPEPHAVSGVRPGDFAPSTATVPRIRRAGWFAASIALVASLGLWVPLRRSGESATTLDPQMAVLLPLRVSGADSELAYLREGMIDLLSIRLGDVPGQLRLPPTADVLAAWRDAAVTGSELPAGDAIAVARRLGAGWLILGAVVGTAAHLTVTLELVDAATGRSLGHTTVTGTERAVFAPDGNLVDRLASELLSRTAGESEDRLADLASRSPEALRTYIDARVAHRRSDYGAALGLYDRAMAQDSTFALAAVGVGAVSGWVGGSAPAAARARVILDRQFDRLSARDRVGITGRLRLERDEPVTARLWVRERTEALRVWPNHPRLHYLLGEAFFHHGPALGGDWAAAAIAALGRSIALDSAYAEPVHHLASVLAETGDTAALLAFARSQLDRGITGPVADYLRWRVSRTVPDAGIEPPALETMDSETTLRWIGIESQDYGFAFDDGAAAIRVRLERPGTSAELRERRLGGWAWALNAGRPDEAATVLSMVEEVQPSRHFTNRLRILGALFAGADTAAAERAARAIAAAPGAGSVGDLNRCVAMLWDLREGSATRLPRPNILTDSEAVSRDDGYLAVQRRLCSLVRDVRWLARDGGDEWRAAIRRLDVLLDRIPILGLVDNGLKEYAHLALALELERAGEPRPALRALERRSRYSGWQPYLATMLRTEARLAEQVGDTARAARALRHYLGFRRAPEPLHGGVDSMESD